jgi:hypothetical protein
MPKGIPSKPGICEHCGEEYTRASTRQRFCKKPDCDAARLTASRTSAGSQQKAQPGFEHPAARSARVERERSSRAAQEQLERDADARRSVLVDAAARLAVGDKRRDNADQHFFPRLQVLREALKAGEHAASRDALIDLIASAAAWAARINPGAAEGPVPGPSWPTPAKPTVQLPEVARGETIMVAPVRTQPGANAVASYVEQLSSRASELDAEQALDRLERILGLGTAA